MKRRLSIPVTRKRLHVCFIVAMVACGIILYYAEQIPWLKIAESEALFGIARYSIFRILFVIPVIYAAFIFRLRGGAITAALIFFSLLPRAVFISPQKLEAIAETIAFLLIGLLISWLIDRQQRALDNLTRVQKELSSSLQTIKDKQEQLRFSEERYRGLFDNAGEAIFVCSASGQIVSVNMACEELTGYSRDELSKMTIYNLFSEMDQQIVKNSFSDKLAGQSIRDTGELCLVRKDGTQSFVQVKLSTLLGSEPTIGLQAIVLDVTEGRRLRQRMQYYIKQVIKAQEDERLRISRELHDDTTQTLANFSRNLKSILAEEPRLPRRTSEQLEKLNGIAESALEELRRFIRELRPPVLDDLGLVPALEWLAANIDKQDGIAAKVIINGNRRRLTSEKELTAFRVAQEALNNVRKHSKASSVEVIIDFGDDALTIQISDNGQGFKMPERASDLVPSGKLGIMGMRERARLVDGIMIIQSDIGIGTNVTLRLAY